MSRKPRDRIFLKWLSQILTGLKRLQRTYDFRFNSKLRRRLSKYLTLLLAIRIVAEAIRILVLALHLLSQISWS
jgi:hypothetical protein